MLTTCVSVKHSLAGRRSVHDVAAVLVKQQLVLMRVCTNSDGVKMLYPMQLVTKVYWVWLQLWKHISPAPSNQSFAVHFRSDGAKGNVHFFICLINFIWQATLYILWRLCCDFC